ncbi:MAG: hypothetical protein EP319_11710 [Deltaproteobacteria bacterium]|nr:MAG: hypothetical protein EP319_11710 [Deltaproteobacteria bacterium]
MPYLILLLFLLSCNHQPLSKGVISLNKTPVKNHTWKDLCVNGPRLEEINTNLLFSYDTPEKNMWFESLQKQPKGVFLILHGLNLRPSKMNTLAHYWASQGYEVLRGTLSGHFGSREEMKAVTRMTWHRDVSNLICLSLLKAKSKGVPLYFLGYSLGAAAVLDTLKTQGVQNPFEKMILLAPAIRVKWYANLTKVVSFFSNRVMIPSGNLKEYRSQSGTSTAAYTALHSIINNISSPYTSLNVPTWIYLDPNDELISEKGLLDMTKDSGLNLWSLKKVKKSNSSLSENYHHLIIDPPTLGHESFEKMTIDMKSFIESPSLK